MTDNKRNISIDMVRGILIVCVVMGHYRSDSLHDILYMFHMPLFFIISGFLLNKDKLLVDGYLRNKAETLLIPYAIYIFLHFLLVKREYSLKGIVKVLWGGRLFNGTYWYITCFLFTLFLLALLLKKEYANKKTVALILAGGGIAVIESNLAKYVNLIRSPGIPWNLDVALLALVYVAIGYYGKAQVRNWLSSEEHKYDVASVIVFAVIVVFCSFNIKFGFYYFDMKPVYYRELILAIVVPCAFGVVIARLVYWMGKRKFLNWLNRRVAFLGRTTIPIMFIHAPLNTLLLEHFKYGRLFYVLIGVGVPVIITLIFSRFMMMRKLFGLPELSRV